LLLFTGVGGLKAMGNPLLKIIEVFIMPRIQTLITNKLPEAFLVPDKFVATRE
jgi:hypothetical protein